MKRVFYITGVLFSLIIYPLNAQVRHSHEIVLGSLQLKDENNLGMVFSGLQLDYRYGKHWKINVHEILYQPKLGFGIAGKRDPNTQLDPETTALMGAYKLHITPVNVTWTMLFYEKNGHSISGGANFIMDYNYHKYDDLHDGPLFWNAEIGISPVIQYGYQWNNKRINLRLQNSLFGFFSHRQGYDGYLWLPTWKDWIADPHKNLKFGSFNQYNHTTLSVEFVPNILKKHSIVYEFDYLGIYTGSRFHQINHNLIWRIALCGKKEQ